MEILKNYLQGVGIVIVFLATLVKELFIEGRGPRPPRTKKILSATYWGLLALGLFVGLVGVYLEYGKTRAEQATRDAAAGRAAFHAALEKDSPTEIQGAIPVLTDARDELKQAPNDIATVTVAHDLALANERLAYAAAGGCIYRLVQQQSTDEKAITTCRTELGSAIYVTPKALKNQIRCTDVANEHRWAEARDLYAALLNTATSVNIDSAKAEMKLELAKAARSSAYFYLCDQLRFGTDREAVIFKALNVAENATFDIPDRRLDTFNKQAFAQVVTSSRLKSVQCSDPCESANAQRRYIQFRGNALTELSGSNVTIQANYAELAKDQVSGTLISKKIGDIVKFKQAIASWNAVTPAGSSISVAIAVRADGKWTRAYSLGQWSTSQALRRSPPSQPDEFGRVEEDTLVLAREADALELRVSLTAGPKGELPRLRSLSVSVWGDDQTPPGLGDWSAVHGTELPVPPFSQRSYAKTGGDAWCSPTSVSMVLGYWSAQTSRLFDLSKPHAPVEEVAQGVSDFTPDTSYRYGNWSFNVAYVNARSDGELDAFVTRLYGLQQLERLVYAGFPVIVSTAWHNQALKKAPIADTDGHLMVVRGFDQSGDVIVNDPAADSSSVRRVYNRTEFDAAWLEKKRTVYLIHPLGRPLPTDGAAGAW